MSSRLLSIDEAQNGSVRNPLDDPQEIGHFSVDANKRIHYNQSQMKYYIPRRSRKLRLDLNVGYEIDEREPFDRDEKMNNLLQWLVYSRLEPLFEYTTNFVCTRSVIEALLCTPFCPRSFDHWIICACRMDDVIYLKAVDTDGKIQREEEASEEQMRMCAWGHKFEQYMTASRPRDTPSVSSTTHEMEEFCIIVRNKIGRHNLLIEAEIDGVNPRSSARPGSGDTSCYVELKTSKLIPNFRSSHPFKKYKSLKWWAQSVTVGIEEIICGLRNDDGIVKSIQTLNTCDLPYICENMWSSNVSLKFCENILTYLSRTLNRNDPRDVYKCEYYGRSAVSVSRLRDPRDRFQVIPDWYVEELRKY